jgi:hypothetical protein
VDPVALTTPEDPEPQNEDSPEFIDNLVRGIFKRYMQLINKQIALDLYGYDSGIDRNADDSESQESSVEFDEEEEDEEVMYSNSGQD